MHPPDDDYKLNFDAATFSDPASTRYGAVIRSNQAEVMVSSIHGTPAVDSDEAELLACQRAIEFAFEVGFRDIVIEGDNATVMKSLTVPGPHGSRLGHVLLDIQNLLTDLTWFSASSVRREANFVAHSLARYARHISCDVFWIEDSPLCLWRLWTLIMFIFSDEVL